MIGFIGLGIMGKPMAKNLIKAGYRLAVLNRRKQSAMELKELGAQVCHSAEDVARVSDIVITMLPDSPQVKEVLTGKSGVLKGLRSGSIVIDMSSIDPAVSVQMEKLVKKTGGHMLDAPVSGGEPKAIDGTLSIMCGGEEEIFRKVTHVLEKMGSAVTLVGGIGSGNIAKIANQMIVAVNIAVMSEAMVLAAKSGVNPETVFHAIKGGLAGSAVMNTKMPMILNRSFDPGFRMELHTKDLNNAVHAAETVEMQLPLTEKVLEMMKTLMEEGKEGLDHAALVQFYEEKEKITLC